MTDRRDLKRRVRERQAATGESYMTALRHVLSQREPAASAPDEREPTFPVVELTDLTPIARDFAIRCRVSLFPSLAGDVDPRELLAMLCLLLGKTEHDRGFDRFRDVVLGGENPRISLQPRIDESIRFADRVRAGVGGITENGLLLAMKVDVKSGSRMVLFMLSLTPDFAHVIRQPTLIIASPDDVIAVPGIAAGISSIRGFRGTGP